MGKGGYGLTYQEVYEMENLTIRISFYQCLSS